MINFHALTGLYCPHSLGPIIFPSYVVVARVRGHQLFNSVIGSCLRHSKVRNSKIVDAASSVNKTEYKRNKIKAGEQRWKNKKMYGQFCRDVNTKALICAPQEALRTNYIKHKIDHMREDDKCRMCGQKW